MSEPKEGEVFTVFVTAEHREPGSVGVHTSTDDYLVFQCDDRKRWEREVEFRRGGPDLSLALTRALIELRRESLYGWNIGADLETMLVSVLELVDQYDPLCPAYFSASPCRLGSDRCAREHRQALLGDLPEVPLGEESEGPPPSGE